MTGSDDATKSGPDGEVPIPGRDASTEPTVTPGAEATQEPATSLEPTLTPGPEATQELTPSPEPAVTQGPAATQEPGAAPDTPPASGPKQRRRAIRGFRRPVELAIRALLVANAAVIVLLLAVVLTSLPAAPGHPAQATPSGSIDVMSMGLAHIPTSASCLLCHETGGSSGLKTIPAIGHPLEGWRRCTTCHNDPTLGRRAPGHQDIAEEECLNCHKLPPEGPTITQPHSRLQDQQCLDCHGSYAHLPTSMVSKREDECWLCHKPTELPPPEYPHVLDPALGCRECHTSPQTGSLPIDHALRQDSTCLLCHEVKRADPAT